MISIKKLVTFFGALLLVSTVTLSSTGFAHVIVKPAEVATGSFQTFTMGVPNEREGAVENLKLLIPKGLLYVSPTVKPGWTISIDKTGEGETSVTNSITWSQGSIDAGLRDDFTFSAKVPAQATELQWKAYQTYADGTVVSWDQAPAAKESDDDSATSGPFSVTKVTATPPVATTNSSDASSDKSSNTADIALYMGSAAVVVSLGALFIASRKK